VDFIGPDAANKAMGSVNAGCAALKNVATPGEYLTARCYNIIVSDCYDYGLGCRRYVLMRRKATERSSKAGGHRRPLVSYALRGLGAWFATRQRTRPRRSVTVPDPAHGISYGLSL
jgi:hypothetical protein